jgi:hypothetical protein
MKNMNAIIKDMNTDIKTSGCFEFTENEETTILICIWTKVR